MTRSFSRKITKVEFLYRPLMSTFVLIVLVSAVCGQVASPTPIVIQVQTSHKDFMDYLIAAVQLATLIALIVYVVKTWQIAGANRRSVELSEEVLREMRATRFQEIAPYVIVYLDMPYSNDWVMYLVVKNTGKTVAKNVRFKFDPPLVTSFTSSGEGSKPFDIYLLREGISLLAPGQEIRTPFDAHLSHSEEKLPTLYRVEVSFADGFQPDRTSYEQILDLSIFDDLSVLQKKGEEDLIKAVEEIARSDKDLQRYTQKIANSLERGLWLNNLQILSTSQVHTAAGWSSATTAKLDEVLSLWKNIHAGNFDRPFRLRPEELQNRLGILASQLLLITSNAPPGESAKIKETLLQIVTRLYELNKAPFYADGGKSFREFNSSGDEMAHLAETAISELTKRASSNELAIEVLNDEPVASSEAALPADGTGKNEGMEKGESS